MVDDPEYLRTTFSRWHLAIYVLNWPARNPLKVTIRRKPEYKSIWFQMVPSNPCLRRCLVLCPKQPGTSRDQYRPVSVSRDGPSEALVSIVHRLVCLIILHIFQNIEIMFINYHWSWWSASVLLPAFTRSCIQGEVRIQKERMDFLYPAVMEYKPHKNPFNNFRTRLNIKGT